MCKKAFIALAAVLITALHLVTIVGCAQTSNRTESSDSPQASLCINELCYSNALSGIPSAADSSLENIFVKSFDLRYDGSGKFEGGTVTVWRYNGTVATEDFWTQGIITLSAEAP